MGGGVEVYDLACGDTIPDDILAALSDDTGTKWAFNANFERVCLLNWLRKHKPKYFKGYKTPDDPASKYLNPASWKCTMIWSAYMGLPLSLEGVGAVLKFQDQKINDRGIMLDMNIVENAIAFDEKSKASLMIAMQNITNLDNPNSVVQMKQIMYIDGWYTSSI